MKTCRLHFFTLIAAAFVAAASAHLHAGIIATEYFNNYGTSDLLATGDVNSTGGNLAEGR